MVENKVSSAFLRSFSCLFGGENMNQEKINARKERAAILSVVSNSLLVSGKFAVGIAMGSIGILSEAVHSSMDLLASGISWWSVRQSAKPPDKEHAYGHGKIETMSAFVEALLIILAALWIAVEAVKKWFNPEPIEGLSWGLGIMALSIVINLLVANHLFKVGKETDSEALQADGHHLAADVWSSVGVLVGLVAIWLTGWMWLDPVIALLVAGWIFRIGWKLAQKGMEGLVDTALPEAEEEKVKAILEADPRVHVFHKLRSRKSGAIRLIDLHVHLDGDMSLAEAHLISHEIEAKIEEALPKVDVIIHLEPSWCRFEEAAQSKL